MDIKILEKGLDYAHIENQNNEPELQKEFEEFCRKMCLKWYLRNETTVNSSKTRSIRYKFLWKPPNEISVNSYF